MLQSHPAFAITEYSNLTQCQVCQLAKKILCYKTNKFKVPSAAVDLYTVGRSTDSCTNFLVETERGFYFCIFTCSLFNDAVRNSLDSSGVWMGTICKRVVVTQLKVTFNSKMAKKDMRYTYNVILKSIRESLLTWKSNKYYMIFCVFVCACTLWCVGLWVGGDQVHGHVNVRARM